VGACFPCAGITKRPARPLRSRQQPKALVENQVIEAVFKFFRPNPTGDGTTEQFYTISIKQGRVNSQKQYVPDTIVPATSTEPPLEEISFVFHTIKWVFTNGGVEHEDTWNQNR